jgi:hypothetical protein
MEGLSFARRETHASTLSVPVGSMLIISPTVRLDLLPCRRSSERSLDKRRWLADHPFLRVLLDLHNDQSSPPGGRQVLVSSVDLCWPHRRLCCPLGQPDHVCVLCGSRMSRAPSNRHHALCGSFDFLLWLCCLVVFLQLAKDGISNSVCEPDATSDVIRRLRHRGAVPLD